MRHAHPDVSTRSRRSLSRVRVPFALGVVAAFVAVGGTAEAQVGSANVPLPNVMLLLDTSGSFEHMIDGSNPEDTGPGPFNTNSYGNNNTSVSPPQLANCEAAWQAGVPALPNRWGVAFQALTGTVLNAQGSAPFYSCVTMDRITGPVTGGGALATSISNSSPQGVNGLDLQYGIRDETGNFFYPYDSGYYLPFHRPVSVQTPIAPVLSPNQPDSLSGQCVFTPVSLPGASTGGVGLSGGGAGGAYTDFPQSAIGTYLYDTYPVGTAPPAILPTPNFGYSSNQHLCTFNQANDGFIDQANTLIRFGLMTFDNDPSPYVGMSSASLPAVPPANPYIDDTAVLPLTEIPAPYSPFTGQWSYDSVWNTSSGAQPPTPWSSPATGLPLGCSTGVQPFQVGARNPAAPPWEGRLIGFPNPNADINAIGQANNQIQTAISALRPYGATPTAGLMTGAEYYFWGDPSGPGPQNQSSPDLYVANGCRPQYIILLTDGGPNLDLRPQCQSPSPPAPNSGAATQASGLCPFQLPEDTASVLANGVKDVQTGLSGTPVFTYVIGFAVSGNVAGTDTGLANCAALAANGTLATTCATGGGPYSSTDTNTTTGISPLPQQQALDAGAIGTQAESPCCSLQRIAVAGGTQHAYFADTPGDLNAALAAVLGDITGQLGSRTLPVAAPTVTYSGAGPLTSSYISSFQAATCPKTSSSTGQCLTPWQSSGPWTGDIVRQQYQCGAMGAAATALPPQLGDDFATDLQQQDLVSRNFLFFNAYASSNMSSTNALTVRPWLNANHVITNALGTPPPPDNLDQFGNPSQTFQEINNFAGAGPTPIYTALAANNGSALGIQSDSCQDPYSGGYLDPTSCANLALSFTMALNSFPPGTPTPGLGTTALNNMMGAYQNGQVVPTVGSPITVPETNRSANNPNPAAQAPLGAILDSTPAVVAAPSAVVRDDSYQAFASALSPAALAAAPRNTMLYVATVDGILHAFDTTAGIASIPHAAAQNQAEAWAFVPPAVLPKLISEYPGASNIALDGSPVVKDVVFSRCANSTSGTCLGAYSTAASEWVTTWHTMLVAGFGLGGRGYYALDVTDPRAPTSAVTGPTYTSQGYAENVTPGSPPQLNSVSAGPHFQWQITSVNLTGTSPPPGFIPGELFGQVSATPAIATVYADPTLVGNAPGSMVTPNPQEIGVAILPGGHDGLPQTGKFCPREINANTSLYTLPSAGLWSSGGAVPTTTGQSPYNVSDVAFPPRSNVRQWATNCSGSNSAVAGRSVTIVSVATGQILAVFARSAPSSWPAAGSFAKDPTAWDVPSNGTGTPLINSNYLIPTPLDSPMTGKPVVYPSGVGVVAQAAYIGDADGTLWRFDLSDPNPQNWTGAIFADAYSWTADSSGHAGVTDWTALDSQPISIEPQLALNSSANLVINFATGDQTAFDPCYSATVTGGTDATSNSACTGNLHPVVNYVYSVTEMRGTQAGSNLGKSPYYANVNWYKEWTGGERVTGPMAVFNGVLYFATYAPPSGMENACSGGGPNLYALDFFNLFTGCADRSCGGNYPVDPNFATGELMTTSLSGEFSGVVSNTTVIPGVSIASTPSCTQTSATASDAYTGGTHTATTAPTPGGYSLMANIGKGRKPSAAQNLISKPIQAPSAPTIVDSWAAVAE